MSSDGSRRHDDESRRPPGAAPPVLTSAAERVPVGYAPTLGGRAQEGPVEPRKPDHIGPYVIVEELGQGGMATVYRARLRTAHASERDVVLKAMLPALAKNPALVEMFEAEARLTTQLRHANIVQVQDHGVEHDIPYLIMEYLDGKNLSQLRNALNKVKRRMPLGVAVRIARDLCRALGYAHAFVDATGRRIQIIHRDVSPSNVMVQRDGSVKLLDFGVAKLSSAAGQAVTTSLKGKFAYMAPEQVNQEPIDRRCDVFAAGIVLHEMLSGKRLFGTKSELETLRRVSAAEAVPPSLFNPEVTPEVDALVMRALCRRADERFDSGLKMAEALEELGLAAESEVLAEFIADTFPIAVVPAAKLISMGEAFAPELEHDGDTNIGAAEGGLVSATFHSVDGLEPGTNLSGAIDLGTNPSGAQELGSDSSGTLELGTNPGGLISSAGFEALRTGPAFAALEEVPPTGVYHAHLAVADAAHGRQELMVRPLLTGAEARQLTPGRTAAAREPAPSWAPVTPLPIVRSAAPSAEDESLFESAARAEVEAAAARLVPGTQAFIVSPAVAVSPRRGSRVFAKLVGIALLLVICGLVVTVLLRRGARGRSPVSPPVSPSVSPPVSPSPALRPAKDELAAPALPTPQLPVPIAAPPPHEETTSLVGLGETATRRGGPSESKPPAVRPRAPATADSAARRPVRSVKDGRLVDPFEGAE